MKKNRLRLTAAYQTKAIEVDPDGRVLRGVSLLQAVEAKGHGVMVDAVTLQQVADLGNEQEKGIKSRFTHPGLSSDGLGKFLGRIRNVRVEADKSVGDLHLSMLAFRSPTDGNLGDYILERAEEDPASFGLSIVADGKFVWVLDSGAEIDAGDTPRPDNSIHDLPCLRVEKLVACDVVDEPAANRDGVFSADLWATNKDAEGLFQLIDAEMAQRGVDTERAHEFAMSYFAARGIKENGTMSDEQKVFEAGTRAENKMAADGEIPSTIATNDDAAGDDGHAAMRAQLAAMAAQLHSRDVEDLIAASGLSDVGQRVVSGAIIDLRADADLETVQGMIDRQRSAEAALAERSTVKGVGPDHQVTGMMDSVDKLTLAVGGLIDGTRPDKGVRPLSGLRELYVTLTGDYEFTGMFQPDRVQFANVTSATMAGLVADALNKRVINQFQAYPTFWDPVVSVENFNTLQTVKWITLGGVGQLPTVAEGSAYTEMTWDDQTETSAWAKKGGYLGLTLEAIDKDETHKLSSAPRALAQAAWMTLAKSFTSIFTSPPTMSDGTALFHADHGNLGSTALSYTAFEALRTAMRSQTELNSGEPLGALVAPKYIMVPNELEGSAIQMLASEGEPGTANNDENVWAEGNAHDARIAAAGRRVIVNDFLSDANDWYAFANPMLYPSIGLGYRFGNTPEVMSVADARSGLMFTNDVMPVKVRWFFAIGPTDWRGVYKQGVS